MGIKKKYSYNGNPYDRVEDAANAEGALYVTMAKRLAANPNSSDELVAAMKKRGGRKVKLVKSQVSWLRGSQAGNDVKVLAESFGVSDATIRDAVQGEGAYARFNAEYPPRKIPRKSRLSKEDFDYIIENEGIILQRVLAAKFGVDKSYISRIWSGERTWKE